ncbi:unnamed protein product, partial [Iphiclides podalirius]
MKRFPRHRITWGYEICSGRDVGRGLTNSPPLECDWFPGGPSLVPFATDYPNREKQREVESIDWPLTKTSDAPPLRRFRRGSFRSTRGGKFHLHRKLMESRREIGKQTAGDFARSRYC